MTDGRRELIDALPGLRAPTSLWRAESIALGGYALTLALSFLVPAASQRMAFYLLVCLPVAVMIGKGRIAWRLFAQHAGLGLAAALILAHVATMAWSSGFTLGHAYHDAKDALALTVFAYVTTWLAVRHRDRFWRLWRTAFLTSASVTGVAALVATLANGAGASPLTGFGVADHPNIAGTLYGIAAILAGTAVVQRGTPGFAAAAALTAAVVATLCVVLAASRAAMLALAAGAAAAALIRPGMRRHAAGLVVVGGLVVLGGHLVGAIDVSAMIAEGSNSRFALWADAIAHIRERPLLGHGMLTEIHFQGTDGLYRSPHNVFLSTQVFAGLPGTVVLLALVALTLLRAVALARAGNLTPLALVVFGLVNGMFAFRTLVDGLDRTWLAFWLPVLLTHAEYEWRRRAQDQDCVGHA